ncbi:MAG: hypothetical protein JSV56_01760 [Methanomassiliicoccales archaeon]|nr:MAG: hypothetical protein JSV56_01760 [Methanomassiliicoccales archaeon]
MKKIASPGVDYGLYPWGKAELTDKWVILHKGGGPKWAISYRQTRPSKDMSFLIRGLKRYN